MIGGWDSSLEMREYWLAGSDSRILLAEDDTDLRNLLTSALKREGFHVLAASQGRELLLMFSAAARGALPLPRVVVMDIRMPGHCGIELLRALRLAEWTMPVVLMTGFGDEETRQRVLEYGAFAMLDKPIRTQDLVAAVRDAIALDGGRA